MAQEREELKQRIREILVELEADSFKNEVLQDLKKASRKETSFFQHPAFLLVLGFFLTGVIGTLLTSQWQSIQQQKQQAQIARERALQQKLELAEQLNKAVAEYYTGTQVILYALFYGAADDSKGLAERETFWKQSLRSWIVSSRVLEQKLAVNFKQEQSSELYQKLVEDSEDTTIMINESLLKLKRRKWKKLDEKKMQKTREEIVKLTNDIRKNTTQLLKLLVEEIHNEESATPNS